MPAIEPTPPLVSGALPWVGAGFRLLRDPFAFFVEARRRLGDTFVVDAFGYRLFCVFSPEGVRALYALPEAAASKGRADYALLRHKVPEELFAGRRNFPHHLFGNEEVETYLDHLEAAVALELSEMGADGRLKIFTFCRRLGHRLGLASWAGAEAASSRYLDRLIPCFERLDASESFVHPSRAFFTWATGKRRERAALRRIERLFAEILAARQQAASRPGDFLDRIWESFADLDEAARVQATARDVVMIHIGSQSNLFAAMGWTLVNLLARPDLMAAVRGGDTAVLESVASESIRLAQRSITLRAVLQPIDVEDGRATYRIAPGAFVTTMLSVTNLTAAPGYERFEAARYRGRRLLAADDLPASELVSTFGHGRHACPAQRFSIAAIRTALARLLDRYELTPRYGRVEPLRRQLGAVARPNGPCWVTYRARAGVK
jgi:cytochrome P450